MLIIDLVQAIIILKYLQKRQDNYEVTDWLLIIDRWVLLVGRWWMLTWTASPERRLPRFLWDTRCRLCESRAAAWDCAPHHRNYLSGGSWMIYPGLLIINLVTTHRDRCCRSEKTRWSPRSRWRQSPPVCCRDSFCSETWRTKLGREIQNLSLRRQLTGCCWD